MSSAVQRRASEGERRTRKLGLRQYPGYGLEDAANNFTFMAASSFLLLYYTGVRK
jgi:Na+/melibiose symporter-like transporter